MACGAAEREAEEGEPLACVQLPPEERHGEDGRGEDLARGARGVWARGVGWWWRGLWGPGDASASGEGLAESARVQGGAGDSEAEGVRAGARSAGRGARGRGVPRAARREGA